MTRIIAGLAGGRRLTVPGGSQTRPTSDRVREAIFSRLEHVGILAGARVLDLYAGSGALGLEAVSRGAREVLLVESAKTAAAVASRNLGTVCEAVRAAGGEVAGRVRAEPVARVVGQRAPSPYDLVFLDPPYELGEEEVSGVLAALMSQGWLAPEAVLVVERSARTPAPRWPSGIEGSTERTYGETRVWYADVVGEPPVPG